MPLFGVLSSGSTDPFASRVRALREGLRAAGYVEGRNVAIESRWADGRYDRGSADPFASRVRPLMSGTSL